MTEAEKQIVNRAIGRIFLMASRPEQDGDARQYEVCRKTVLDLLDPENSIRDQVRSMGHDASRDYYKGASGQ